MKPVKFKVVRGNGSAEEVLSNHLANQNTELSKALKRNGIRLGENEIITDYLGKEISLDLNVESTTYYIGQRPEYFVPEETVREPEQEFNLWVAMNVSESKFKKGYVLVDIRLPSNMTIENTEDKVPYYNFEGNMWSRYVPSRKFDMTKERNLARESIVTTEEEPTTGTNDGYY